MSLQIVIGPMFAGKTSEIHRIVRRYRCLNKKVLVLTADIDTRYSDTSANIISHDRVVMDARAVPIHEGLYSVLEWNEYAEATAIVVDEAQFFIDCLIPFVRTAVDRDGKHLVVVGLDSDANQEPFGDVLALIAHADIVEKKTALCQICCDGTPAIFTRKLIPDHQQYSVGGSEQYESVCRKHFNLHCLSVSSSRGSISPVSSST